MTDDEVMRAFIAETVYVGPVANWRETPETDDDPDDDVAERRLGMAFRNGVLEFGDRSKYPGGRYPGEGERTVVAVDPETSPNLGTERPTPIKAATVAEAVSLILKGDVVELAEISHVHTVLSELAAMAVAAEAAGERAPTYDLCKVTVSGTSLFCGSGLRTTEFPDGVPRLAMPQLSGVPVAGSPAADLPKRASGGVDGSAAFIAHLEEQGIAVERAEVPASHLRATQNELIGASVAKMMTSKTYDPAAEPIFISRDDYVIDGHHRWAAVVGLDAEDGRLGDSAMKVIRVDAPISEVLHRANRWARAFGIAAKGMKALRAWVRAMSSVVAVKRLGMTFRDGVIDLGDRSRYPDGKYPGEQGAPGVGGGAAAVKRVADVQAAQTVVDPVRHSEETLATARAVAATGAGADQLLDVLGAEVKAQVTTLFKAAAVANVELGETLADLADALPGATISHGPIKGVDRSLEKVVNKDSGDLTNLRDPVRASVAVDTRAEVTAVIDRVHESLQARGGEIVASEDRFSNPTLAGYRDLNLNVQFSNGVVGEIQVHVKAILEVKNGEGHTFYKQWRAIAERPPSPESLASMAAIEAQSKAVYDAAWRQAGGR